VPVALCGKIQGFLTFAAMYPHFAQVPTPILEKAGQIKLLITDCDGVLTDTGVYVGAEGELMKRFSIRDGMGVERLRELVGVASGIMTGEQSQAVAQRAKKLQMPHLFLGAKKKAELLKTLLEQEQLRPDELAYIGDDTNDLEALALAGLSCCPGDAMPIAAELADYQCQTLGGHGVFREVAELIIYAKQR
jgi:3-deoxy-D-manno-octulosonate 8-phosphate phosphatase (KDO 8-P phosphatase)